jgi:hypothetical protein
MASTLEGGRASAGGASPRPISRTLPRPRFFFAMSVALLVVVFLGFAPTFYLSRWVDAPTDAGPMPLHLVVHALFMTAWFGGLVIQSGLIQRGRYGAHRTLGLLGIVCFAGVVVTGAVATIDLIPRDMSPRIHALATSNTFNLLVFATLVPLALVNRARPAVHMRLMLIASITIIGPAVGPGRQLGIWLGSLLPDVIAVPVPLVFWIPLVGAIVAYDVATMRRVHPATLWGGGAKAAATVITMVLVSTGAAAHYVAWLRGL